jgi:Glycosyltransferase 61
MKIKESNYLVPPEFYENACVIETDLIKLESTTDYIMARSFDNYYHWLVQTIPGLDWSARNIGAGNVTLLSGDLKPWQAETLEILGYDRVSRIVLDPGHHYSIPRLEYSEFQNGSTAFEISLSAQRIYDRLAAAAMDGTPANTEILYVARTDSVNRAAENEEALIGLLEAEGVRVVVPGSLSVRQQVNLFGKTRAVIGPHGAGLTNIVFCRPGTIFYEFLPSHYLNPCFSRLAQAAGLEYQIDLFDSAPSTSEDPHARGWILDTDLVLSRIVEIKRRIAATRLRTTVASILPEPEALSRPPMLAETTHLLTRERPTVEAAGFLSRVWRRVVR